MYCGLETITIPNSIESLGINCLSGCQFLNNIVIEMNRNQFSFQLSYKDFLYNFYHSPITCSNMIFTRYDVWDKINELKKLNGNKHFIIPFGVVKLAEKVFLNQKEIQSITIPTTVTSIGKNCFKNCSSLTSLLIPISVKSIKIGCFEGCDNLKELSLPLYNKIYPFKVTYEDYLILKKCNINCDQIVFTYENYCKYNKTIPLNIPIIFDGIKGKFTIPTNLISLQYNHLSTRLKCINIPVSVTYLCDECFKNYSKLQSITLPITIKYIGKHLIDGCTSLTKLNYEGDLNDIIVSYIDYLRFKSKGLIFHSIEYTEEDKKKYGNVIPSIVHSIHRSYYDRSFNIFHIPNYVTSLDNSMFALDYLYNCSKLRNIIIPTSIQTIPEYCFSKCYLLTMIELPSTLTTIKKKAFSNCILLKQITIPSSVNLIEQYAFEYCYSLTSITLPTILPTIGMECFKGCYQIKESNINI